MFSKAKRFPSPAKLGRNAEQKEATAAGWARVGTTRARTTTRPKALKNLPVAEMGERMGEDPSQEKRLLSFLTKSINEKEEAIQQKESDLECPVCLEIPAGQIFSCVQQHLVCSQCRPRVSQCPQCRRLYPRTPIRHRYAEKSLTELDKLRLEKLQLKKEQRKLTNNS